MLDRSPRRSAAEPTAAGGSAAGVRWDLSHLYASPDDPALEADLDGMLEDARRFAADYRGRVAALDAAALGPDLDLFEKLFDVEGAEGFILFQNVVAIVDWISLLFHY